MSLTTKTAPADLARGYRLIRLDNTTTPVQCDHCTAGVKRGFVVTNTDGAELRVGRACVKTLTGWNLTDALAARLLAAAARAVVLRDRAALVREQFPTLTDAQLADVAAVDHNWNFHGWTNHARNFLRYANR